MDIIHFKNQINIEFSDDVDLKGKIEELYTYQGYRPSVTIDGNIIHISIDDHVFDDTREEFQRAMSQCERGDMNGAEKTLHRLLERCPLHSESYRVLAQISMGRKQYDKAINYNIEALRIDPTNLYGLISMGNLLARTNDIENADKYYQKALEYHPEDPLAINNIAGNHLRSKRFDEAISAYEKVLSIDGTYLNSYYGLAMCHMEKGDAEKAFDTCLQGMKNGTDRPENPGVREHLQNMMEDLAKHIANRTDYGIEIEKEKNELSRMTTTPLRIESDSTLTVHAKLEYAPTRRRDYHRVAYNPQKPYFSHLLMHEFMHLEMAIQASEQGKNQIIYSESEGSKKFREWLGFEYSKLKKTLKGSNADELTERLFSGLILQVMNCPLDMLVEDRIHDKYGSMRAIQFISLLTMERENVKSIQSSEKTALPAKVVKASKVMNMVTSMHFKEMYGYDFVRMYKATPHERALAEDLYEEYKAYKDDYKPGEEYDLVTYFAEMLDVEEMLKLRNEIHFKDINLPPSDSVPLEARDAQANSEQNDTFRENHQDGKDATETMMMAMYMLDAMKYFEGKPHDDVLRSALEIATVGINGISPSGSGYKVQSIPNREFGGYEFLAYYYVSWAKALPEKLNSLGLPFKEAYKTAQQMYNSKN
ncbi:MAG: tetratricopeptide repeat protein [Bacteroidaceae bacterium]|nr:tetratricopeptide repeat protein [Bacteroidaceae bacterium]